MHLLSQRPDSTGSGIYLQAMIREAARHGHYNSVLAGIQADKPVTLANISPANCLFLKFDQDIPYQIVGMSDVMPYKSRRFQDLNKRDLATYQNTFLQNVDKAVERFQPDIIHSHHLWIMTSVARKWVKNIPIVTTSHGSDLRQLQLCPHLRELVQTGCQSLDAVMALSESQKAEIAKLYNIPEDRIHVVGAGYDDHLFCLQTKPEPDPVRLVYAGKLSEAKGVPWMLRALAQIESPSWELHLVGGGSGLEKDTCLSLADRLGGRIKLYGAVPQEKLAEILGQSHIFCLPSFYEGLPLVVIESLASGCRIIANDLPGTHELIGNLISPHIELLSLPELETIDKPTTVSGKDYEKRLEAALRSQIQQAVENPMTMGPEIRNTLQQNTWTSVFERVQQVYDVAINRFNR